MPKDTKEKPRLQRTENSHSRPKDSASSPSSSSNTYPQTIPPPPPPPPPPPTPGAPQTPLSPPPSPSDIIQLCEPTLTTPLSLKLATLTPSLHHLPTFLRPTTPTPTPTLSALLPHRRALIRTDDLGLHLVHTRHAHFLKPLPSAFALDDGTPAFAAAELSAANRGYMRSYAALVRSELDYELATQRGNRVVGYPFTADGDGWRRWCVFRGRVAAWPEEEEGGRWAYGQLELERVNAVAVGLLGERFYTCGDDGGLPLLGLGERGGGGGVSVRVLLGLLCLSTVLVAAQSVMFVRSMAAEETGVALVCASYVVLVSLLLQAIVVMDAGSLVYFLASFYTYLHRD